MKIVQFREYGGAEVLELVPAPCDDSLVATGAFGTRGRGRAAGLHLGFENAPGQPLEGHAGRRCDGAGETAAHQEEDEREGGAQPRGRSRATSLLLVTRDAMLRQGPQPILQVGDQAQEQRHEEQREDGRDQEPADDHAAEAAVELRARSGY